MLQGPGNTGKIILTGAKRHYTILKKNYIIYECVPLILYFYRK